MEVTHKPAADIHPLISFQQDPANRLVVPTDLARTDPLALKSERLLKRSKRDAHALCLLEASTSTRLANSTTEHCGLCRPC